MYDPGAVVLQCGADSLAGDRLGCFNLSLKGHGKCLEFLRQYNVPLLLLGGGGYTIRNVARCWTYETSLALNSEISNSKFLATAPETGMLPLSLVLPYNDYYEYFGPDFKLHILPSNMVNHNNKEYLDKIKVQLLKNLKELTFVPSVQMQPVPPDAVTIEPPQVSCKQQQQQQQQTNKQTNNCRV